MASVSAISDFLAGQLRLPIEDVRAYARTLINADMLPKSSGRAVAQVAGRQAFALVLGLAASDRSTRAAQAVRHYAGLTHNGRPRAGKVGDWPNDLLGYGGRFVELAGAAAPSAWKLALTGSLRVRRDHPRVSFQQDRSATQFWKVGAFTTLEQIEEHDRAVSKLAVEAVIPASVLCGLGLLIAGSSITPADAFGRALSEGVEQ